MTQERDPPSNEPPSSQPQQSGWQAPAPANEPASAVPPPAEPAPATPAAAEPATEAPASNTSAGTPPPRSRSAIALPLLLVAAIVPAVIVGILVFALTGGGGNGAAGDKAAGIVDGLFRLGPSNDATISSFRGELPPDFSDEFPIYDGADIVVAIAMASLEGTNYFMVLSTADSIDSVYRFYSDRLDRDPWQVEVGRASEAFTGLRFSRPDSIDISGDVTLYRSELDNRTSIYLSYQDISQAGAPGAARPPFSLSGGITALPPGFPNDVPIYSGAEESIVLDTYFERAPGGQAFIVSFITRDSQDAVLDFYTEEFTERGWNVSEAGGVSTSFALSIDFDDGGEGIAGSITTDAFERDPAYTRVDMLIQVSAGRRN